MSVADLVSRIGLSGWRRHLPTLAAAISVIAFLIGMAGLKAHADETGGKFNFEGPFPRWRPSPC